MKYNRGKMMLQKTLFTLTMLLLIPFTIEAQYYGPSYDEKINKVDMKIQNLMFQRKTNRAEQDKINNFVAEAGKWFASYSNIQNKINQAKRGSGDYSTFTNQRLQQILQELEQEKKAIHGLNGGATIQGKTFDSIDKLQSELTGKSEDAITLVNEDEKIGIDIQSADMERDQYVAGLQESEILDKKDLLEEQWTNLNKKKMKHQLDYNYYAEMLNNDNFWCAEARDKSHIKCIDSRLYIIKYTKMYSERLKEGINKKISRKELIEMIMQAKEKSDIVKQKAHDMQRKRKKKLLSLQKQMTSIEQQLYSTKIKTNQIDPSGCWVIVIGKGRRPEIRIKENANGEYDAYIIDPGPLNYKRGKRLFTMARINASTFEGTEFSYSDSGRTTRIAVRLIITKNRNSIEYRTRDDLLTLMPCR
jgi:hypothetical protein